MTLAPENPEHLTQRQLESMLLAAANALRGPVDPGDFKSYVFPVFFFKWISDISDYHHDEAVADLGDGWTQELEDEYYQVFSIPEGRTGTMCLRRRSASARSSMTRSSRSPKRTPAS